MSRRHARSFSTGCAALFLFPFALVGIATTCSTIYLLHASIRALSWETVPATVDEVTLKRARKQAEKVTVRYRYQYRGGNHVGTRVWFGIGSDNIGSFQQRMYDDLSAAKERGQSVPCYVDPNDPTNAVLFRGIRWEMIAFLNLFSVVFGGIGVGGLIGIRLNQNQERRLAEEAEREPNRPWLWEDPQNKSIIRPANRGLAYVWWMSLSLLILLPMLLACFFSGPPIGFVEMLALIPLAIYLWAGYAWLRYEAVSAARGEVVFKSSHWPITTAGPIAGTVEAAHRFPDEEAYLARLEITKHSSGDDSGAKTIHAEEQEIVVKNSVIPIAFSLPEHMPVGNNVLNRDASSVAQWRLLITNRTSNVERYAFTLAVFDDSLVQQHRNDAPATADEPMLPKTPTEPDDVFRLE